MEIFYDEVSRRKKIMKNANQFILDRKLIKVQLHGKNFIEKHLPTNVVLGTLYAIKNNSIFEFNSMYANNDLPDDTARVEYYMYQSRCINIHYKSTVTILNLNIKDVGGFANANQFLDMNEMISYDMQKTINFLVALVKNDFDIYIKQ